MANILKLLNRHGLWLALLVAGFVVFSAQPIEISSDMSKYMMYAKNIFEDQGYTDASGTPLLFRAPGFPALLAGSFYLFGPSPWSAFLVVRLFCILTPVLLYFIGLRFYGKLEGTAAALLALTSYAFLHTSYQHLDVIWPFFTLLGILLLYEGLVGGNGIFFLLAGLSLGSGYLIKQSTLVFFPLPFLLLILAKLLKTPRHPARFLLYYTLGFTALSLPWIFYVYSHDPRLSYALIGGGSALAGEAAAGIALFDRILRFLRGLLNYYSGHEQSLSAYVTVAPLLVLGGLSIFYEAFKRRLPSALIALGLVLISPAAAISGNGAFRFGQLLIVPLLLFLGTGNIIMKTAVTVVEQPEKIVQLFSHARKILLSLSNGLFAALRPLGFKPTASLSLFLVLLATALLSNLFSSGGPSDRGGFHFISRSEHFSGQEKLPLDSNASLMAEAAQWADKNLTADERIMCSWHRECRNFSFFSQGSYEIVSMPMQSLVWHDTPSASVRRLDYYTETAGAVGDEKASSFDDIVLLSANHRGAPLKMVQFYFLSRTRLEEVLSARHIDYVLVGKKMSYLSLLFSGNSNFEEVRSFGNGLAKIFKVRSRNFSGSSYPVLFDRGIVRLAEYLQNNPDDKRGFRIVFNTLCKHLGFCAQEREHLKERMRSGSFEAFAQERAYN